MRIITLRVSDALYHDFIEDMTIENTQDRDEFGSKILKYGIQMNDAKREGKRNNKKHYNRNEDDPRLVDKDVPGEL